MVALSYGVWHIVLAALSEKGNDDRSDFTQPPLEKPCPQEIYYVNLHKSFIDHWNKLGSDFNQTELVLRDVSAAIVHAKGLAASTELSALNAIFSASDTGELGRGFVTVAKEMSSLGQVSREDLHTLSQCLLEVNRAVAHFRHCLRGDADTVILSSDCLPYIDVKLLVSQLRASQEQLRVIDGKYRSVNQYDVRWSQLHESMRDLLKRLTKTLFSLEIRASEVFADLTLIRLSESTFQHHLLEFEGSID